MTQRNLNRIALASSLGLLIIGCTELGEGSSVNEEEPRCDTPDCVATPNPTTPLPDGLCMPQATGYDTSVIPSLPADADFVENLCAHPVPLESATLSYDRWSHDPESHTVTHASANTSGGWNETTFTLDEAGRARSITTTGVAGFYAADTGETLYELDTRGRLTRKVSTHTPLGFDSPTTQLEKIQRYEGDQLVERVERDLLTDTELRRYTWTYDDAGRLTRARLEDSAELPNAAIDTYTQEARWSYDDAGRPARVERFVYDHPVLEETWTWSDDGTLTARTYSAANLQALAESLDLWDSGNVAYRGGLDDLEPTFTDWTTPDPWAAALSQDMGDCRSIPHGPGHGYPQAEGDAYLLGVPAGERPAGIGFAYGYSSYGWFYGDQAWYGHGGVATLWPGIEPHPYNGTLDIEVRYDADARAITEDVTLGWLDGTRQSLSRTRSFSPSGLASDSVIILTGTDAEPITRTLRFERDARGALTQRTLEEGPELILATQTWTRDNAGRPTHHAILPGQDPTDFLGSGSPILDAPATTHHDLSELSWRYDDQGRLIERSTNNGHLQTLRYDDQGRLVETRGDFNNNGETSQTWQFDDRGNLTETCTTYGEYLDCTTTTHDDLDRPLLTEHRDAQSTLFSTPFAYLCE